MEKSWRGIDTSWFKTAFCLLVAAILLFAVDRTRADNASVDSSGVHESQNLERQPVLVIYQLERSERSKNLTRQGLLNEMQTKTRQLENQVLRRFFDRTTDTLWIANATRIALTPSEILEVANDPKVQRVEPLKKRQYIEPASFFTPNFFREPFTYGLQKIRIPELRARSLGIDGRGVRVGIIDTGIDPRHPDLVGRVRAFKDFTPKPKVDPYDDHGHGTHIAGTIAGGDTSGQSIGVAPQAELIVAKGFDAKGGADDAELIKAMQWMADPDGNPQTDDQAHIVSSSWGNTDSYKNSLPSDFAFCRAVDSWVTLGIVPVFSSGNEGPDRESIIIPGACPNSFTVGATDEDDDLYSYSSIGPAKWKNQTLLKPEIVAPGVDVYSAAPGKGYRTRSGTSMAVPHVAGMMAILLQARPQLKTTEGQTQLRKLFTDSSYDLGSRGPDNKFGHGRIDVIKAMDWLKANP